jgi:hypothetical protein
MVRAMEDHVHVQEGIQEPIAQLHHLLNSHAPVPQIVLLPTAVIQICVMPFQVPYPLELATSAPQPPLAVPQGDGNVCQMVVQQDKQGV